MASIQLHQIHEEYKLLFDAYCATKTREQQLDHLYRDHHIAVALRTHINEDTDIMSWYSDAQMYFADDMYAMHTCFDFNTMWRTDVEFRQSLDIIACPKCTRTIVSDLKCIIRPTLEQCMSMRIRMHNAECNSYTYNTVRQTYRDYTHAMIIAYCDNVIDRVRDVELQFQMICEPNSLPLNSSANIFAQLAPLYEILVLLS
jgi:hypothetical protein